MSNLYIRVRTSFFSHRKTARLRSLIGDAAFWVPLKLWAYAAENQPDGDLSGYEDGELEMLLGCPKDAPSNATSIIQALRESGYLQENGMIHGWEEHNGYHASYSERAKKAAAARWAKKVTPAPPAPPEQEKQESGNRKQESGDKQCLEHACSMIYAAYPRKVAKPVALKAIAKALSKVPAETLLAAVQGFAKAWEGGDLTLCPHPATWFNQERYNDAPETWNNGGTVQGQLAIIKPPTAPAQAPGCPPAHVSESVKVIQATKELERVEARLKKIADGALRNSWGIEFSATEKAERGQLLNRKTELMNLLGFKA